MRRIVDYLLDRPKLLIFMLVGLVWISLVSLPSFGNQPVQPQVTIKNAGLCLSPHSDLIPANILSINDEQYVCASLKSDTHPIRLTLLIYKENGISPIYSADNQFIGNTVSIPIFLASGKYRAKIMYARSVLAEFKFEVTDK